MIDAAILAGGRARRMGGLNKALIVVEGRPIVVRQIAALQPVAREILLVVDAPFGEFPGARVVIDRERDRGPLGGIATAFAATDADLLVVACDLPFLSTALLERLRDHAPAQAVVPRLDGRPQPLCARYSRSILPIVEERLASDRPRVMELLDDLEVAFVDDVDARVLANLNAPSDLPR